MHATILHESDLYKSGLIDKIRAASVVHWRIGVAAMSYGVLQVGVSVVRVFGTASWFI